MRSKEFLLQSFCYNIEVACKQSYAPKFLSSVSEDFSLATLKDFFLFVVNSRQVRILNLYQD